jgi:hypothetical protein
MELNTDALKRLHETMRGPARQFADYVAQVTGPNLKGLAFYGSILRPKFDPKRAPGRSVLLLDHDALEQVRQLAQQGRRFGRAGLAAPLIMTPAYIQASRDTFPLELIEIQQEHATVLGETPFAELTFETAHVRLQCERECKTILIGMRQGLLAAADKEALLADVADEAAGALARVLRGLLWLKGRRDPCPPREMAARVEGIVEKPLLGVQAVLAGSLGRDWAGFRQLYEDVRRLGELVDAW